MSKFTFFLVRFLPTVAVVLGLATPAHAVLTLSLNDGGVSTIVTDTDGDGIVSFNGSLAHFTVNASTGVSMPALVGAPTLFSLNTLSISDTSATLILELTDTDFSTNGSHLVAGIGGTTDGTISYEAYVNEANGNPFLGSLINAASFKSTPFAGSGLLGIDLSTENPFSLGIRLAITHKGNQPKISSVSSNILVPEPGSLSLLATGLIFAGLAFRRQVQPSRHKAG